MDWLVAGYTGIDLAVRIVIFAALALFVVGLIIRGAMDVFESLRAYWRSRRN